MVNFTQTFGSASRYPWLIFILIFANLSISQVFCFSPPSPAIPTTTTKKTLNLSPSKPPKSWKGLRPRNSKASQRRWRSGARERTHTCKRSKRSRLAESNRRGAKNAGREKRGYPLWEKLNLGRVKSGSVPMFVLS